MTFPAIAAVRETLPKARITVLVKPWVADLVRMHPAVDEVMVYERPGRHDGLGGLLTLARELREKRFDAAILLQNAIEAAVIARLARIPVRAGYSTDARGLLLTHPVRRTPQIKTVHQSLYYLEMLKALGFRSSGTAVQLQPTEQQKLSAERLLGQFGIAGRRPIVGMAPGAAYGPAKRWFPERFAAVADRLAGRFTCPVVLFGSSGDRASTEAVQSASKSTSHRHRRQNEPGRRHRPDRPVRSLRHERLGSHARGRGPRRAHGRHLRVHQPADDLPPGGKDAHRPQARGLQPLPQDRSVPPISDAWISSRSTRCTTNRYACWPWRAIPEDRTWKKNAAPSSWTATAPSTKKSAT